MSLSPKNEKVVSRGEARRSPPPAGGAAAIKFRAAAGRGSSAQEVNFTSRFRLRARPLPVRRPESGGRPQELYFLCESAHGNRSEVPSASHQRRRPCRHRTAGAPCRRTIASGSRPLAEEGAGVAADVVDQRPHTGSLKDRNDGLPVRHSYELSHRSRVKPGGSSPQPWRHAANDPSRVGGGRSVDSIGWRPRPGREVSRHRDTSRHPNCISAACGGRDDGPMIACAAAHGARWDDHRCDAADGPLIREENHHSIDANGARTGYQPLTHPARPQPTRAAARAPRDA